MDVAAGTGDFARELRRQGQRAVATDLSYNMLHTAKGVEPRVQADASHLPFRWGAFDGVTCGYALRNFTDLEKTFSEMARVLRPGGRLSLLEVAEPDRRCSGERGFVSGFAAPSPYWFAAVGSRRLPLPAGVHGLPA